VSEQVELKLNCGNPLHHHVALINRSTNEVVLFVCINLKRNLERVIEEFNRLFRITKLGFGMRGDCSDHNVKKQQLMKNKEGHSIKVNLDGN